MKPRNIFLFFLSVLLGVALLMFIFPENGIRIGNNYEINFITWNEFLNPVKSADITDIINQNIVKDDEVEVIFEDIEVYDTVYIDSVPVVFKPVLISVDSNLQRIEMPNNADSIFGDLFNTFNGLRTSGEKIHVLHYGDSQIEVDRMTDYFRMKLQNTFGGYGSGYHLGIQAFNFGQPMVVSYSENWRRYRVFPQRDTLIPHKRYGISTSFSAFRDNIADSNMVEKKAWISFQPTHIGYTNVRHFNLVKLFYGYNTKDVNLEIFDGETKLFNEVLPANENLQIKSWNFQTQPQNVKFVFSGKCSPEIYGYSFEAHTGVMVDNISVRGSTGTFFGMLDFGLASQIYANLDVRLILMQFGGNIVHSDSARIRSYANSFSNQLKYLKIMAPNAAIIVIGPADMSVRARNSYVTHKKVPYIVEKLRVVALDNNCAFWDMYNAMGGENSMPSWVFHDPPLAEKDFIHFTPNGARIIAKMFYKALILEYNEYIKRQTIGQ